MINTTTGRNIISFLLLISCIVISAGFVIKAKPQTKSSISVSVEQLDKDVNVVVRIPGNTSMQFYMFSIDGSLVRQMEITESKKFSIEHLSKGVYLYELFNKDQRLKRGDIQIK